MVLCCPLTGQFKLVVTLKFEQLIVWQVPARCRVGAWVMSYSTTSESFLQTGILYLLLHQSLISSGRCTVTPRHSCNLHLPMEGENGSI